MNKLTILFTGLIFLFGGCKNDCLVINSPFTSSQPNILLIIADDLGIDATPGYSIGPVKPNMPNLQNLASDGITFDNFWVYPVCSPTRSSIITGRYGYRTGVLNPTYAGTIPSSEKIIQKFLDENTNNAYSHSIIGKWHLSKNEPDSRPTQMGVGYYAGLLSGGASSYNNWRLTENGQIDTNSDYITTKITDLAIDWIKQQDNAWFCWVAYTAPHTPFHLPPDSLHSQGNLPSDVASINANPMPYFMAMVESVDHEIGRIMDNIPSNELDNTIIIFIGDNGTHPKVIQSPYKMNQGKGTLYQGGINVPMIISGSGVTRMNARDNNLISSTDLFSTIAEIAGVNLPTYEDSYSFNSLLTNPSVGLRKYNYSEVLDTNLDKSGYTIRSYQYKLIVFDSGQQEFYDLSVDPYEDTDLLSGRLTTEQEAGMQELIKKVNEIRQ